MMNKQVIQKKNHTCTSYTKDNPFVVNTHDHNQS